MTSHFYDIYWNYRKIYFPSGSEKCSKPFKVPRQVVETQDGMFCMWYCISNRLNYIQFIFLLQKMFHQTTHRKRKILDRDEMSLGISCFHWSNVSTRFHDTDLLFIIQLEKAKPYILSIIFFVTHLNWHSSEKNSCHSFD